jgi:hypothetical protein
MDDNDPECPSPRTAERRRRRAAALAKFQSDAAAAAKLNYHRHRYSTNVSYIPATNPANTLFSHQVQMQMLINAAEARAKQFELRSAAAAAAAAAAAVTTDVAMTADVDVAVAEPNDILPKDVPSIVLALQSLRIQLIIDPTLSVNELTALCAETSRNEALAAGNPANSAEFARLKQLRVDLEAEVDRCKPKMMFRANSESAAKPTPHVRIASGDHCGHSAFLGNILTSANMRRTFVSITALIAAVNVDIGQFLTSPTRSQDRIAVLHSSSRSI